MVNAQEWLDRNFLKTRREEIKNVLLPRYDFARIMGLEGHLDLRDFVNLKSFDSRNFP